MEKFNLSDRYRLELHWEKAFYEQPGICKLETALFKGPALIEAVKLNDSDYIMIDFYSQYIYLVKSVYIAKLSWNGVNYNSDGSISLKNVLITHASELNRVPKLNDNDYLVIDTYGHEVEDHLLNLVYKTYVVNKYTSLYQFRRL